MVTGDNKDVGFLDDVLLFLQHGICAEDHAIQSHEMTKDENWLDLAITIRRMRSKWQYRFIPEKNDERYCFTKHCLGMAQTLKEMGNRYTETNEDKLAKECFSDAVLLERMFKFLSESDKGGKRK